MHVNALSEPFTPCGSLRPPEGCCSTVIITTYLGREVLNSIFGIPITWMSENHHQHLNVHFNIVEGFAYWQFSIYSIRYCCMDTVVYDSHLTACSTRLSRGLRLGSLVEERMPVPQLFARVLLSKEDRQRKENTCTIILYRIYKLLKTAKRRCAFYTETVLGRTEPQT